MGQLCFIDTETTGLDPRIHQPWEVCTWLESEPAPQTRRLVHTLQHADQQALAIGGYWKRSATTRIEHDVDAFARRLVGVTLVGSNPSFDAAMLTRVVGTAVWHHRFIDVSNVAMIVLDEARPLGLAAAAAECRARGYDVPEPDHTAEGDVRTTRAVYEALRELAERSRHA
jgi:hypothetical protein